jgi:hypothetical protein
MKDYTLNKAPPAHSGTPRIKRALVPPRRPQNLLKGGGRHDSPGWTEHKRKTNRWRFDLLRPFLKTGVTIWFPSHATPEQLKSLNDCNRNFCKENKLAARSVWEGPGFHQHIALGISHDSGLEQKWRQRLEGRWLSDFNCVMPSKSFLWLAKEEPEKLASYLSKTTKHGQRVKGDFPWLTFHPAWEIGFRPLLKCREEAATSRRNLHALPEKEGEPSDPTPRKKRVTPPSFESPEKESDPVSPRYTVHSPEKEGEAPRTECPVCWTRWGRSLWAGSCKCNPAFPQL